MQRNGMCLVYNADTLYTLYTVHCPFVWAICIRVEQIFTFLDFQDWAHCGRSDIFLEVHCHKIGDFCRAHTLRMRGEVYTFKKSYGALKFNKYY